MRAWGILAAVSIAAGAYIVVVAWLRYQRRRLDDDVIGRLIRRPSVRFTGMDEAARKRSESRRATAARAAANRAGWLEQRRPVSDFRRAGK